MSVQRIETDANESVVLYCWECDSVDPMREMHPGHRLVLIAIRLPVDEDKIERARNLGRMYFAERVLRRRSGPFTGRYACPQ